MKFIIFITDLVWLGEDIDIDQGDFIGGTSWINIKSL